MDLNEYLSKAESIYKKLVTIGQTHMAQELLSQIDFNKQDPDVDEIIYEELYEVISEDDVTDYEMSYIPSGPALTYRLEWYIWYGEGPRFVLDIRDASPFKIKLTMWDSYLNPIADDAQDLDFGKYYIDDAQLLADGKEVADLSEEELEYYKLENDNWEPDRLMSEDITITETDEIWPAIKKSYDRMLASIRKDG